ncbi:cyclophane-containing peptide 2OG-Fe(II) oxygenase YhhC [Pedobacter aquatilis]|uniref:cyclophane-containing peptide 2OG-Fe(II) oxygenase YhhC n=1 Tax=Pedobacter aquatilis TaxID=351343 RepID=UPI0025B5ACB4|nr:cyclophane-containing peptide 2OG-Fe(II) oxygenase YhhC [Pedobacter aquatilis]MDN3585674.1 cyclophane-containing peptide 2OG-Fe(II) oxygenase YhhC [Pedobacter aquatilis]
MRPYEPLPIDNLSLTVLPFPHFISECIMEADLAEKTLEWLKTTDEWQLTETDFYTQHEFSLMDLNMPKELAILNNKYFTDRIAKKLKNEFLTTDLELVGITAHLLVDGYKMGVHNDFLGKQESHRLVIQLNENWKSENGGYLMLFGSKDPQDVATVISPVHNSGIAFEISSNSYHAVSTVHNFKRFTLVYTYNQI